MEHVLQIAIMLFFPPKEKRKEKCLCVYLQISRCKQPPALLEVVNAVLVKTINIVLLAL